MDPKYTAYGQAQGVTGDILEIGLGDGEIARSIIGEARVRSVTNYEIDDAVSDKFAVDHPGFHDKHTLMRGDYLLDTTNKRKYDIGIVDLFYNNDSYAYVQTIVTKMIADNMKTGGKIMVEYSRDVPEERAFRAFMEANTSPMETEFINTGVKGSSRHVCYYEI